MELRLPLCGPEEQPLDVVLRRCKFFFFFEVSSKGRTPSELTLVAVTREACFPDDGHHKLQG